MFNEPYKIVEKAYGKEVWLVLNDKFCMKHIFINKGHRSSLQYHNVKREAMFVLSGKARVTLEVSNKLEEFDLDVGSILDIPATVKHRVEALEDLVFIECSTPEVDDLVRIEDDYNRK
ncbi:ectoine synthase [Candidatus Pacearchaeota archaeon]|nr:ectoine synthase [Candidatus Pacearchaeota archaeon]